MSHFLWPRATYNHRSVWRKRGASVTDVENYISQMYPGTSPVLFSSARAGIAAVIAVTGLRRGDLVWVPPFSSHCVFDAVSRLATPTTSYSVGNVSATLVFHQWGYPHVCTASGEIIEDAADSLFLSGARLFPNNGRFALWSLPKIVGSAFGGVVFCRSADDADKLRRIQKCRGTLGWIQFILKVLMPENPVAQAYWHGAEAANGSVPGFACGDILVKLDCIEHIVDDRRKKLDMLMPFMPSWLQRDALCLPSNVPIECDTVQAAEVAALGFSSGLRQFNRHQTCESVELTKVLPIAIHQDVSVAEIESVIKVLNQRSAITHSEAFLT